MRRVIVIAATFSSAAAIAQTPPLPPQEPPRYARCEKVTLLSPPAQPSSADATIVAITGDRVRWVESGLYVNDVPFSQACPGEVGIALPDGVPEVDLVVPITQYFVTFRSLVGNGDDPASPIVRREMRLIGA